MKVTILFFSTNRLEFLIPSLDSFFKHVNFGENEIYSVLIDDYPKDRDDEMFRKIQKKYNIDKLILHEENQGYSKTWKEGWDNIPENTDFIFHQEDDFTYHTEIEISSLTQILKRQPKLYQIVLKRQIWYEPPNGDLIYKLEKGQLETFEESFEIDGKNHYITGNRNIFNANPCLYPYFITQIKYGNTIQEHMILTHLLKKHPDMYGCFYGKRLDPPLTTHIGHFTQGKRMLPGENGYETYKVYNPDKKYDAKKWLTEYKSPTQTEKKQLEKNNKTLYFETIDDANRQSDTGKKIEILQKAIKILPEYLDAYYFLMMEYQNKKEYLKAYLTGISAGNKWKTYKLFRDFKQQDIYKRLFYLNLALNAYYAEFYDEAFIINKRILDLYPNDSTIVGNQSFYENKIDTQKYQTDGKNNDLSTHFNMKPPKIMVFEDFYKNPDKIRDFALNQEFKVVGNYPGKRTESFHEDYHKEMFEKLIGEKITWWPDEYNGCFQIVTQDLNSWIHRDKTDYSAIVFLNPEPEISTGGTVLYRHKETGLLRSHNDDEEKILGNSSNNLDDWETTDTIGNLYNRCIIFQGRHNHKSNKYFGDHLYNGRLFQIFFFNTENTD